MPASWVPDPQTYPAQLDESLGWFTVDLAALEHAPLLSHPRCLRVRLELDEVDDEGLPADPEAFRATGDALAASLGRAFDAIPVGHLVSEGAAEWVYYLPDGDDDADAEALLAAVDEAIAANAGEPTIEHDPEWSFLIDFLAPDPFTRLRLANHARLEALDDRSPVPLTHALRLPSLAAAERATAGLAAKGFAVSPPRRIVGGKGQSASFTVWATRDTALEPEDVDDACWDAWEVALDCEGAYDGWTMTEVA
jgi:hypothetical protein